MDKSKCLAVFYKDIYLKSMVNFHGERFFYSFINLFLLSGYIISQRKIDKTSVKMAYL